MNAPIDSLCRKYEKINKILIRISQQIIDCKTLMIMYKIYSGHDLLHNHVTESLQRNNKRNGAKWMHNNENSSTATSGAMKSGELLAFNVNIHFQRFEIIKFLAY